LKKEDNIQRFLMLTNISTHCLFDKLKRKNTQTYDQMHAQTKFIGLIFFTYKPFLIGEPDLDLLGEVGLLPSDLGETTLNLGDMDLL